MKKASVTYTKNNLSKLLSMVREGETVLVMDRKKPVARLSPVDPGCLAGRDRVRTLVEAGVIAPPRKELDVEDFLRRGRGEVHGGSVVDALLEEREESL